MTGLNTINTPGVYYAIGYMLSSGITIFAGQRKRKAAVSIVYLLGSFLLLAYIMHFTSGTRLWFPVMTLVHFTFIYLAIRLNTSYVGNTLIFLALGTFMIGEFMSSFHWMIYYFAWHFFDYPSSLPANIFMLLLVHGFMSTIFYIGQKGLKEQRGGLHVKNRDIFAAALIVLALYSISNVYYLAGETLFGGIYASELFIIRTLVDLGGVAILYGDEMHLVDYRHRLEQQRLNDILAMQQSNYEVLEQAMELVNIKYHDLKHQIATLKEGLAGDEALDYLDKLEQEIRIYESQNKTGNRVLDTILTAKSLHCKNNWIELTVVAEGEALDFMEPMDISALFGNLIDNAIESVERIEHKERRLIHLAVTHQKGFVRIRLENCYEVKPNIVNGRIVTSKSDKKNHGFGLKSIEAIVKKYGGSVTIQAEDGWFEQRILLPMTDDSRQK